MENWIEQYWEQIESGEVIVGKKIHATYKELIRKMNDPDLIYEYDHERGDNAIQFIERFCKHSKGKWAGKPIELNLWQKAYISAVFGFVHKETRLRMIRELVKIIARKNGKSTTGSGMSLKCLVADGEGGAEVVAVSTKKDAAKIVWNESVKMIKKSPALNKRLQCRVAEVRYDAAEAVFKPLASDSNSLDGLNVSASFMDEVHAWKDKNLYDVIVDSMSTREQPLNIIMTTAGYVREGIYDIKYRECENLIDGYSDPNGYRDDSVLPIIYELDDPEEIHDERFWQKANPALGTIKNVEYIRKAYNKAMNDPVNLPNLLTKDFNIRHNGEVRWLTYNEIVNDQKFDIAELKPRYAIGGADLSGGGDLTAACVTFKLPGDDSVYTESMYWLPEDLLEEHIKTDGVPYDLWVKSGHLRLTSGNDIDFREITKWFKEIQDRYNVYLFMIGYDRWSARYWVKEMEEEFGKSTMVEVAQGAKTFSFPMKEMAQMFKKKKIIYNANPITEWCLMNTVAKVDENENVRPVKGTDQRKRIDGMVALLDSYVVLYNNRYDYDAMI